MNDDQLAEILSVITLPEMVSDWLKGPVEGPFASDEDYVQALCIQNYLHHQARETRERLVGAVYTDPEEEAKSRQVLEANERVVNVADRLIKRRLFMTLPNGLNPRLARLSKKYFWTPREFTAFQYMLAQTLLMIIRFPENEIHHVMAASGMTVIEILRFVDPSRDHIQEGLFEIEKGLFPSVFKSDFRVHDEVAKALVGADLSTDDLLKLDGTTLYEVLAEEPGFMRPDGGSTAAVGGDTDDDDGGLNEDDEQEKDVGQRIDDGETSQNTANLEPGPGGNRLGSLASSEPILEPYTTDLEYLRDCFRFITARVRRVKEEYEDDTFRTTGERNKESILREMTARERVLRQVCEKRLDQTRKTGDWLPRTEELASSRSLDDFEKWVLLTLVGLHISDDLQKATNMRGFSGSTEVGELLTLWADGLEEQVERRKHFYKSGRLVKEGLIQVDSSFRSELRRQDVDIDRRMMDFIVGLESEASDLVEGSHLYTPQVLLDNVILPDDQKKLVLDTAGSFNALQRAYKRIGLEDSLAYGRGLVMLFYGPSGTGKTMLANGIANHLGKKIFLVNYPTLGSIHADEVLAFLFREARIHEAILFFDECEGLFESREHGNMGISTLLTEIERHDGPIIMATNRPFDLDEAMNRRITLAVEFRAPDPHLRADIWRVHLPPDENLGSDVDVDDLARRYELTGGFIKNAVISALSFAVARDQDEPQVLHGDLDRGARLQLRSRLRMTDLERRVVPSHGLDWLVVPDDVREVLQDVVHFEKARKVLYGQWNFDRVDGRGQGVIAVFHGSPGTGKTQAAEGIAYEIGRPLRMVNTAELMSKYVGETAKNIDALFTDLHNHDAVLLFEEAEGLFGARTEAVTSTDRHSNVDTGLLLHHIERYPGLVLLTTNMLEGIDPAFQRRMRYVVEFPTPTQDERARLWRQLIPEEVPLGPDVELEAIAAKFNLTGGGIKNAVYRAAARAALREAEKRMVTMDDLLAAASEELASWERRRVGFDNHV